jgi:PAS domain S-box-containing protein
MVKDKQKPPISWALIGVFIVVSTIIVVTGSLFINLGLTLMIFIITVFGTVVGGIIWYQRVMYFRDRYEAELEQMALRQHFDYILKYANDVVFLTDKDLNIVEINDKVVEMYQYTRNELIGQNLSIVRLPELDTQIAMEKKKLDEVGFTTFETIHRKKDGTTFQVEISARCFEIEGTKYYQSIGRDITDRKKSEFELEKSLSLLRATIESTADGLLVVDISGKIISYNSKFAEMWRIPLEILNTNEDEKALEFVLNQLKEPDSFLENVKDLYSSPEKKSLDILEFIDGRVFERYSQPQKINNEIVGRVWSFRDITQSKIAEDQLRKSKENAEESDRLKTAFLQNISHEIRTPMNAIVGFTSLLDEPDLDEKSRKRFIEIITQSSDQLLSIISAIVDISNIETGQVKNVFSDVNINTVIKDLFDQYRITAEERNILFRYETRLPDKDAIIKTDRTKFIQIISNLLNNAFKFITQGTITFGYRIGNDTIEFFVKDTGIGVPEEKQNKIFERFYQVKNDSSRQYSGAGLGLSICKAYVEILGGKIWLNSKTGDGSEFCFTLPVTLKKDSEDKPLRT